MDYGGCWMNGDSGKYGTLLFFLLKAAIAGNKY